MVSEDTEKVILLIVLQLVKQSISTDLIMLTSSLL